MNQMWKPLSLLIAILAICGFFFLMSSQVDHQEKDKTVNEQPASSEQDTGRSVAQKITQPPIPTSVTLAGEAVPLNQFDVKERLDRELMVNTYFHSKTLHTLKLANRFFPVIEPILAEEGMPDDLKYVAMAESGLLNAVSPKNAKGMWQFLSATGKELGLEVSTQVDERYHLAKATRAACKYFKRAHNKFDSWAMAIGSYNMGMSGLNKQSENQKQKSYYDLYLNDETSRYVFRILAFKLISENPKAYGFQLTDDDLYPILPTKTMEITEISNIASFAKENNTTYKTMKLLNPWLRSTSLAKRKSGKTYTLLMPSN